MVNFLDPLSGETQNYLTFLLSGGIAGQIHAQIVRGVIIWQGNLPVWVQPHGQKCAKYTPKSSTITQPKQTPYTTFTMSMSIMKQQNESVLEGS